MNMIRVYTLRVGTKKHIEVQKRQTLQDELKKLGITESDIYQTQIVHHNS